MEPLFSIPALIVLVRDVILLAILAFFRDKFGKEYTKEVIYICMLIFAFPFGWWHIPAVEWLVRIVWVITLEFFTETNYDTIPYYSWPLFCTTYSLGFGVLHIAFEYYIFQKNNKGIHGV
jgi:hypothetical protein